MKRLFLVWLLIFKIVGLIAETPYFAYHDTELYEQSISLRFAVEMAATNNQELQKAKEDVRIAEYNYKDMRGQLFPQLNFNAGYKLTKNQLPKSVSTTNRDREEGSISGQLALSQPIFLGGKLINGIRVLDRVKSMQEKRYELELQNMIVTVINAYYDLYLAQEGLSIQLQALENAELHLNRVETLFSQGLVSEYDKLRAELEVSRLYPEVLNYENIKNLAVENFKRITGFTGDIILNPVIDDTTLSFLDFEITIDSALSTASRNRIELYLINLTTEIYHVQYEVEKKNFLPNLSFQADLTKYTSSDSYSISGDDFGTMGSVGLVFRMPIFTGMSNTSKTLKAKHELRKAESEAINTSELINLEIRQTLQSFTQSKKYLETQEMNLGLAERALNIAVVRFQNQSGIQLEVFDAQIQYNTAQISLVQAKIRIIKDYFALNKALGNNLFNMLGEL